MAQARWHSGAVRTMDGESLEMALARLRAHKGPVSLAWVASQGEDPRLLAVTVRAGITADEVGWQYPKLQIRRETASAEEVAGRISAGRVTPEEGPLRLDVWEVGNALWCTTGVEAKLTAPLTTPSYYYTTGFKDLQAVMNSVNWQQPLSGPSMPYFARASDAAFEVLYGLGRQKSGHSDPRDLLIELPYLGASIQMVTFEDQDGVLVTIGEVEPIQARDHTLHAAWMLDEQDLAMRRQTVEVGGIGTLVIPLQARPYLLSLGLVDSSGALVDSWEGYMRTDEAINVSLPLAPQAVAEALDHLDSVWRNAMGDWLFHHAPMTQTAGLAMPVQTRADFESRLSYLADTFRSARIPDALLPPESVRHLPPDASLGRLKVLLNARLQQEDAAEALAAVALLGDAVRLRVALQHPHASDLASAMAKLGLMWPGDWGPSWEVLRRRVVGAIGDLRRGIAILI